ncbi:MAG: SGNH/GDSL hydrolase family protein [Roseivirga sp.]
MSYLALGDSYTIGESVNESERWPNQLADSLNQTGANILTPKIIAKTGWRTDQLKDTVTNGLTLGRNYGLVSLLIGVNNQVQGQQVVDFEVEFAGLLSTAISFAGSNPNKVIVLSIPDYGKTVFGQYLGGDEISHEIDQYNEVIKRNCAIQGVRFFDITPISREVVNDSTLLGGDNFHPSGKMYNQWVALLFDEVNRILTPNP